MNGSFIINCWGITVLLTSGSQKSELLICTISHFARVGEGFLRLLSDFVCVRAEPISPSAASSAPQAARAFRNDDGGGGVISRMKAGRRGNNPPEMMLRRLPVCLKPGERLSCRTCAMRRWMVASAQSQSGVTCVSSRAFLCLQLLFCVYYFCNK